MRATIIVTAAAVAAAAFSATSGWAQDQSTVMVENSGEFGDFLVDHEGMALYMFEKDQRGEGDTQAVSNCYDKCATNWPPLLVEGKTGAGDGIESDLLGTTERKDGSVQATYGGYPLYYFVRDENAGDTSGQGVNEVWYLVSPAGEVIED